MNLNLDVYSRNNLSKIKDGVYVINLDEFKSLGTHWIAFYVNCNNIIYCSSFGSFYRKQKCNNKYLWNTSI